MLRLSKEKICSFAGDVLPLWLVGAEESGRDATFSVEGDAVKLRSFANSAEYAFTWGVLLTLVKPGTATVRCEHDGKIYTAEVEVREMHTANGDDKLEYYLGDMHDHTSENHNHEQFASHEFGDITDYIDYQNNDARLDFAVISDHAGVTNDRDFFRGFVECEKREPMNLTLFPGAESEVMYTERDRFGILHRKSGEIVTFNSAGYTDMPTWDDFYREMSCSPLATAIFAHPHVVGFSTNGIWHFDFKRRNNPFMLGLMRGIEMGNGADRKENLLHEYAYSEALDAGFRVSTTCSSDCHGPTWGYDVMPGKTVIMAYARTKEAFIDAFRSNRFYATESGNVKLRYSVNGKAAPCDLPLTDTYAFHVELSSFTPDDSTAPVECRVISDYGNAVISVDCRGKSAVDFTVKSDTARYFYLRLVDGEGRKTWSMPVWCGRPYDVFTEPEIEPIDMSACTAVADGKPAPVVINGDPLSSWYGESGSATVDIDMSELREISAIGYHPHIILRDKSKGVEWTTSMESSGLVSRYSVSVSLDGKSYNEVARGTCQTLGAENIIAFTPTVARYVRFEALSNIGIDSGLRAYAQSKVRIANLAIFEPRKNKS